jgi:dihydrofolate synthase/folylpolyglutamate synthase
MNNEPEYQATLDYLYRFVDYSLVRNLRYTPEKFDLTRMFTFMRRLGNPENCYPAIHVAGTKGKGSVSALCASALQAGGYRVGLYTSPHLSDYAERIQVDGQPISHADLVRLVAESKDRIEAVPELTTFEITTALAFLYFQQQGVNAAVIEVGLGGRLDPTNVITPNLAVITSISYDHEQILGHTLEAIAGEKAGIIKPGVPVVVAPQSEPARQTITQIARQRGAPCVQVGRDFAFAAGPHSLDGQRFTIWSTADHGSGPVSLDIPLLGYHQVENAATAYTALHVANNLGLPLSQAALRQGFQSVHWPGRFEILQRQPPVIVDAAHNRDSMQKLRRTLDEYFPGLPVVLVFGASEDKDILGMLTELLPRVSQVVLTRSFHPRAADPAQLEQLARPFDRPTHIAASIEEALSTAQALAGDEAAILVTGSLFIAAGGRDVWQALGELRNEA